jgi:hypothetical protein
LAGVSRLRHSDDGRIIFCGYVRTRTTPRVRKIAAAKRDAPLVAQQLWTHGFAAGPKGRFAPYAILLDHLGDLEEQGSCQEPARLSLPSSIEKLVIASGG